MKILKVKLVKGGESVELLLSKQEGKSITKSKEEHSAPVHADFIAAMKSLAIHFGILTDYIKPKEVKNISQYDVKLIEDFTVTGYSIGGDEEDRGVTITGMKRKSNGKMIIINTPFTRFVEAEESQYQFIEHLEERITEVEREVEEYLKGKVAPDPQQTLDFPEPGDNDQDNDDDDQDNDDLDDFINDDDDHDADDRVKTVKPGTKAKKAAPKKKAPAKKSTKKELKAV